MSWKLSHSLCQLVKPKSKSSAKNILVSATTLLIPSSNISNVLSKSNTTSLGIGNTDSETHEYSHSLEPPNTSFAVTASSDTEQRPRTEVGERKSLFRDSSPEQ
ncbi:hypothetical protein glysoja_002857 [Glycine soja]|nr:hypothetical protein glysoja_002857 [Glycine soja]